jgi:hypothetical protein
MSQKPGNRICYDHLYNGDRRTFDERANIPGYYRDYFERGTGSIESVLQQLGMPITAKEADILREAGAGEKVRAATAGSDTAPVELKYADFQDGGLIMEPAKTLTQQTDSLNQTGQSKSKTEHVTLKEGQSLLDCVKQQVAKHGPIVSMRLVPRA